MRLSLAAALFVGALALVACHRRNTLFLESGKPGTPAEPAQSAPAPAKAPPKA